MSESWGGDAIPPQASGRLNLVEALSVAQHMPAEAMDEAAERPHAIAGPVLAVVERAAGGGELTERERNLLFWGVHVLGQVRDTRLFRPLVDLLRRPGDEEDDTLGVALVLTVPTIVVGVFDGDIDRLEALLADAEADESARWAMFPAYAFLVFDGRIDRERAHAFLVRFDDERLARAGDLAWSGWETAIALLGFADLAARREAALAEGRLLVDEEDEDGFGAVLEVAAAAPDDPERFAALGLGQPEDLVGLLEEALASEEEEGEPEEPARNPLRHVGRNDPCPCGSGRKFKKCCLDGDAA